MLISLATSLTFLPPCSSDITLVQSIFLVAAYAFAEPSSKPIVTRIGMPPPPVEVFLSPSCSCSRKSREIQRIISKT